MRIVQAGEVRSSRLESLRAVAALGVVVGHASLAHYGWRAPAAQNPLDRMLLGGLLGVILFFALSGYLLYWPFARRDFGGEALRALPESRRLPVGARVRLGSYARNRALRILPLYVAVVVALHLLRLEGAPPDPWWRFLTFSQGFTREFFGSVFGPMWSLVVELHFYVLLPLIAWALARTSRSRPGRAAAILGALGVASLAFRFYALPATGPGLPLAWRFSLLSLFCFFVPGMLLAILRARLREPAARWLPGALGRSSAWILVAAGLWAVVALWPILDPLLIPASFLVVAACVLPLREGAAVRSLDWKPLALVGVISYSVYLLHVPVIHELTGLGWANGSFPMMLAVSLAATLVLATATYAGIERPTLRLRNRWGPTPPVGGSPELDHPPRRPARPLTPSRKG